MKSKTLSLLAAFAAMTALSFAQEPAPAEAAAPEAPAAVEAAAAKTSALAAVAAEVESVPDTDVAATTEASSKWLEALDEKVNAIDGWVWGPTLIGAILVTGILLTCILRFVHLLNLRRAFRYTFVTESTGHGEVTSFGALCTALSATIGTGNIVGVATAIGTGGPGALFWMEVAAFFGMATKYAEGLLAVRYREIAPDGSVLGGPFYYIEKGLGRNWKWLAVLFAVFGVVAGIMGIGTITQIQGITSAADRFFKLCVYEPGAVAPGFTLFEAHYSWALAVTGLVVTGLAGLVLIGGLKRIASVSTVVVPFMAVFYVVICLFLLVGNLSEVTAAIELVVRLAFNPRAVAGGVAGTLFVAIQKGVARGIFSNEAGLGSAPIAAAAAKTNEPVRQGLVCMTGTFIDTIVICTMTGLAIVVTGAWDPALHLEGVDITIEAFRQGLGFLPHADLIGPLFLSVALAFFAFTTILGWDYYSEKCLEYLVGRGNKAALKAYRVLYVLVVFVGPYLTVSVVWGIADVFNGLMAFPNLVALVLLSPTVGRLTRDYFRRLKAGEIKE